MDRALKPPGCATTGLALSAGALLTVGIAAGLAGAIEALSGRTLQGATAFLFGQILVGTGLVRTLDGAWRLQDPRLLFVLVYGLYGIAAALGALSGTGDALSGLAAGTFLYGTGLLGFNAVQAITLTRWVDIPAGTFRDYPATVFNVALVVVIVGFVFAYAASRGVNFAATIDRRQGALLNTQLWVVTILFANGVMMYAFAAWQNLGAASRTVVVVSVASFIALNVTLGNRRDYLFIILFIAAGILTRRRASLGIRNGLVLGGGALLFLLFGVVRQIIFDPRLALENPVTLVVQNNEFVYPIQTLTFYVSNTVGLHYGATYAAAPTLFIPRVLWPGKPESLGFQFLRDAFGTTDWQGFAYTPVTEAYLNFGWVGPLIALALVGLLMARVVRGARTHPFQYLLVYSLLVDFNRSDLSSVLYAYVIIGAGLLLQYRVALLFAPSGPATRRASPARASAGV